MRLTGEQLGSPGSRHARPLGVAGKIPGAYYTSRVAQDQGQLHRLAAFADAPGGGNLAGVWVGNALPDPPRMQQIAADVGYSETAFIAPGSGLDREVRYYSPEAEVTFCGHATIASGVVIGRDGGAGRYVLASAAGPVPLTIREEKGAWLVTLESVEPQSHGAPGDVLEEYLSTFGWSQEVLHGDIAPAIAYAGAWHLILPLRARDTLAALAYEFDALKALMLRDDLTTIQVVCRESQDLYHSRNPFPVGGVVEDAATGAAAAALGGYLRAAGHAHAPATITILQGFDMGRPSRLLVDIPESGGIRVTGSAVDVEP